MISRDQFLDNLKKSGLLSAAELEDVQAAARDAPDGEALVRRLTDRGTLTAFQVKAIGECNFSELTIGSYVVLDRLGAGGMGTVYKARHRRMKRIVALKVLSKELGTTEQVLKRFEREVEAISRLSHPNIVMAFDAGEAGIGHFLIMEFVDGRDLHQIVRQGGQLPLWEAVHYILQAATALSYAHSEGIIHRDIKPSNLMRDKTGAIKVTDLGLVRFQDNAAVSERSVLTESGAVLGTVDYLPPEQAMDPKSADHRVDIYSLGCTLYFLLAGKPPFRGDNLMATIMQHCQAPIPSLRQVCPEAPPALEDIYRRMMAKNPDDRYATMAEVVQALTDCAKVSGAPHPFKPPVSMPTGMARETTPGQQSAATPAMMQSALLVEPSRFQSSVISKLLEKAGMHRVDCCQGGQQALDLLRTSKPAVVVSTMYLADMNATELLEKMRRDSNLVALPFVLISTEADVGHVQHLGNVGQVAVLTKPFGVDEVKAALSATMSITQEAETLCPSTGGELKGQLSGVQGQVGSAELKKSVAAAHVLVVDDNSGARRHIRGVLGGLGFQNFAEADDGTKAVALLEARTFDLVVTDYNMPEMDGERLVLYIRKRSLCRSVPVIMTTAETNPQKLEAIRQLGVLGICDKSFKPEAVKPLVETLFTF
jgi:serine/threonine protein kinase